VGVDDLVSNARYKGFHRAIQRQTSIGADDKHVKAVLLQASINAYWTATKRAKCGLKTRQVSPLCRNTLYASCRRKPKTKCTDLTRWSYLAQFVVFCVSCVSCRSERALARLAGRPLLRTFCQKPGTQPTSTDHGSGCPYGGYSFLKPPCTFGAALSARSHHWQDCAHFSGHQSLALRLLRASLTLICRTALIRLPSEPSLGVVQSLPTV
jgi:hypothetical protein